MKEWIRKPLIAPFKDVPRALFAPFVVKKDASIAGIVLPLIIAVVVVWFLTVPIHELLHAAGCLMSGGEVRELHIQRIYGGEILARPFSFVRAGGDYAGQLKDFDTGGRDYCYMLTVALPYILTVILGVPMLRLASRNGNALFHGIGVVHILLPLASITGDYYEMGSIIVTRIAGFSPLSETAKLVRGDDLFLVLRRVSEDGFPYGILLVAAGFMVGVLLIWPTWNLSLLASSIITWKPLENGGSEA